MAAGRKTGGRKPGSKNKATKAREKAIASSGLTPLDFMLKVMRNGKQPADVRLEAAKAAAPYVHPKLSAVTLKGDRSNPLQHVNMSPDEFAATAKEVAAEV